MRLAAHGLELVILLSIEAVLVPLIGLLVILYIQAVFAPHDSDNDPD